MKNNFELAKIFTDNMVFQANKPIIFFGKCKKNIDLHIKFLNQEQIIKTKSDTFRVEFLPEEVRESAFSITISSKKQSITLYNCLIGDVYLFAGGMNVKMVLADSYHNQDYDSLNLRFVSICNEDAKWESAVKDNFETFSAIAYLFAKGIHEVSNHPIGIINCTHEQSRIFSWMSNSDIESNKEIKHLTQKYKSNDRFPLYQSIKKEVIPHNLKGIIFYQGENDFPYFSIYENALQKIIKCLRFDFNDLKLPFFVIQIAGYDHPLADDYSVSMIRIAQANVATDKDGVYLVPAIDFGEPEFINPKDKHLVAKRLTDIVLEKLFKIGKNNTAPSYYTYQETVDKLTILVKDNHLNLMSKSGQYLGFTYSVDGVNFLPLTDVVIANNRIVINKDKDIKEIRYAMKKYPPSDIITTNNLPLLPFYIKF